MKVCAARDQGPSSAGMARHLAPFSCRQTIAEIVRRRSWGGVLPLGRHASISGSRSIHAPSVSIALSSFQEGQNARHHNQFKLEQALIRLKLRQGLSFLVSTLLAHGRRPGTRFLCPGGTQLLRRLDPTLGANDATTVSTLFNPLPLGRG